VIREGHRRHVELRRAGRERRDPAGPVEDRILGVDVKVDERRCFGHGKCILDLAQDRTAQPAGTLVGVESRTSRLAKNEALFRDVNERITEISQSLAVDMAHQPKVIDGLVCECSDPLCTERVGPLTVPEYEAVRGDPRRFIIARNHHAADVESVIEKQSSYWIVEKDEGVPAEVARELDPRS
jgi:hypothetical protein